MSNDFDRDDEFGEFDDDFSFDDEFDEFRNFDEQFDNEDDFDDLSDGLDSLDDDENFGAGDDFDLGFLDEDEEDDEFMLDDEEEPLVPAEEEGGEGGGGVSRTFLFIAGFFALLMLCGLTLIGGFIFGLIPGSPAQQTEVAFEETRVFRLTENANRQTQIAASATAAAANETATQSAAETATAQFTPASPTPSDTPTPTEDLTATAEQEAAIAAQQTEAAAVDQEAAAQASETAFALTLNPPDEEEEPTSTPPIPTDVGSAPTSAPQVDLPAVQQTATALAAVFNATPTPEGVQPTSVVDTDGTPGGVVVQPPTTGGTGTTDQLPDTGLFDDVFQSNPMFILMMVFGLLGVIAISRGVRASNRRDD